MKAVFVSLGVVFVTLCLFLGVVWYTQFHEPVRVVDDIREGSGSVEDDVEDTEEDEGDLKEEEHERLEEEVASVVSDTSEPLTVTFDEEGSDDLTVRGVLIWTNAERVIHGLSQLQENPLLSEAARMKAVDMLDRGYFAHDAPDGTMGASELADTVGYEFILVGENLAWGNFPDNRRLVTAWMESPGHRENILKEAYSEIGVAVVRGEHEGRSGWMAVQIFGTPRSACPQPDAGLSDRIDEMSISLDDLEEELDRLRDELESMDDTDSRYSATVQEYNTRVDEYNERALEIEGLIDEYNEQIDAFNECASFSRGDVSQTPRAGVVS